MRLRMEVILRERGGGREEGEGRREKGEGRRERGEGEGRGEKGERRGKEGEGGLGGLGGRRGNRQAPEHRGYGLLSAVTLEAAITVSTEACIEDNMSCVYW